MEVSVCLLYTSVCRSKYVHMQRPVLIDSWEAAYFDFTGDAIVDLEKEAASLVIDMVVMDDGWFGKRNDEMCIRDSVHTDPFNVQNEAFVKLKDTRVIVPGMGSVNRIGKYVNAYRCV